MRTLNFMEIMKIVRPPKIDGDIFMPDSEESDQKLEVQRRRKPAKMKYNAGRNELCPCGSGKKFKKCCINVKAE